MNSLPLNIEIFCAHCHAPSKSRLLRVCQDFLLGVWGPARSRAVLVFLFCIFLALLQNHAKEGQAFFSAKESSPLEQGGVCFPFLCFGDVPEQFFPSEFRFGIRKLLGAISCCRGAPQFKNLFMGLFLMGCFPGDSGGEMAQRD